MDKLLGFTPDADPALPGVITACTNLIPYENGMKGAPTGNTPAGVPALAGACSGAAVITKLDDNRRTFAGTSTKLYELSGGAWADVARASVYTGGIDNRWSFAQFGNSTLASNLSDTMQRSAGSGAFADIASAPKAKIIFSVGAFVMALNTVDGTYGTTPNRWWCCASYDETSWTPSVSTLATTGQLVSTAGQITAGGRLGEYAVAYKDKAIYVGQFVGAPAVWDWVQVPGGEAGCVGQEAWCDIGAGGHFIVGQDNFWQFDGSRPQPLGVGQLRQWFFDNSSPGYRYKTKCVFDRQNNVVWTFYCSLSATTPDMALVYHLQTQQWGSVSLSIEAALNYIAAGATIDDMSSVSATIDGLSGYALDSQFWNVGGRALSVVNASHQLQALTGICASSNLTTGDAGDDDVVSTLTKIRLRFAPGYKPSSASVQTYSKMTEGDPLVPVASGSLSDGKFDVLQSARWHRASFSFSGDHRIMQLGAVLIGGGNA